MRPRTASAVAASTVALGVAHAALASVAPSQSSILAAVRAQRSYHYVAVQKGAAAQVRIVGDAATNEGIQRITFRKGARNGHVTVVVAPDAAYVRGDSFTLANYMGLPADAAAQYAGRWLRLAHTAPEFAAVAADVRLDSSTLRGFRIPGPVRQIDAATVGGRHVVGIRGKVVHAGETFTQTLYVRATGAPLPVEQTVRRKGKLLVDIRFSKWNEAIYVATPSSSIALP